MDSTKNQDNILRAVAVILVALCVAGFTLHTDANLLWKIDHTSAADYIAAQRHMYQQSYAHHFFIWILFGALFVGGTEFVVSVLRILVRRKPAA